MKLVRPLFWLLIGFALSLAIAAPARADWDALNKEEGRESFPWILTPAPLEWDYISSEDVPFPRGPGAYTVRVYERKTGGRRTDRFTSYTLVNDRDFPPRFGIWTRTDAGGVKTAFYMRVPDELAALMSDADEIANLVEMNVVGTTYVPQGLFGKFFTKFLHTGELPGTDDRELAHHH